RGRGRRLASPPVADRARELGIALSQPESVNAPDAREQIAAAGDAAARQTVVVCAFGALIKEPLLSEQELLNVHPSLLPRWRGAAPVERAIMAGDRQTGVSIMRLTAGLDSGPVCMAATEPVAPEDTYGSLAPRLAALGGDLLVRVLDLAAQGQAPAFEDQDESGVTYAEKIGPEDRLLDPSASAVHLERVVRALHPHIGARLELDDGGFLGVHAAAVLAPAGTEAAAPAEVAARTEAAVPAEVAVRAEVAPGERLEPGVLAAREGRLLYGTVDGVLELLIVQPPGGRPMDAASFLRGHGLPAGQ
ncbi:MAG TPA: methionyl-tRNA formyltransferase, partial [Solirubrobacteraceae bacterium]|nr:methionyl-tRNA formyltransferase [Solirubrobacteraceae bacterium]